MLYHKINLTITFLLIKPKKKFGLVKKKLIKKYIFLNSVTIKFFNKICTEIVCIFIHYKKDQN